MKLIEVDGKRYEVYDTKITRGFQILDGDNTGRLMNGSMGRDVIGTYYNYTWELSPSDYEEYDELYEILSAPTDYHIITVPYGRNSTKTYQAYVTSGQDELVRVDDEGNNYWEGLSIQFVATNPARRPS